MIRSFYRKSPNHRVSLDAALSSDCSAPPADDVDRIVARTPHVVISAFRLPVEHPRFRDTGPIARCIVVFPRTSVWIRHEASHAFLADPTVATIYNRGQRYERLPHSRVGDRCDWFAVSDELAREIVGSAYRAPPAPPARVRRAARRRRDLAEAARAELVRTVTRNQSVHNLATTLGTSPYHLCRVFRAHTGRTLHGYRTDLRLRLALELLEPGSRSSDSLSAVAHALGFASHSHFVTAMRRGLGETPSAVRSSIDP